MQNTNLEKIKEFNNKLFIVIDKNKKAARNLCLKIDKSNGQLRKALIGDVSKT